MWLYKTQQIIKNLTGKTLDLRHEKHRHFINEFITQINPYIEAISKIEQENKDKYTASGCGYGCLTAIGGCTAIASTVSGNGILLVIFIPPLLGWFIGYLMDEANKNNVKNLKIKAENNLKRQVENFVACHPLT